MNTLAVGKPIPFDWQDFVRFRNMVETRLSSALDFLGSVEAILSHPRFVDEPMYMLRNKFGLSKKDAKKLYYDVKSKGPDDDGDEELESPSSTDDKLNVIMTYMKETSTKLDKIEEDIAYLKDQVEKILQKV